jgi:hypothetical protein
MTALARRKQPTFTSFLALSFLMVLLTAATFGLLGYGYLMNFLGGAYHPNFMEGHYGTKYMPFFLLAVAANWLAAMIGCWRIVQNFKGMFHSLGVLILIVGVFAAAYNTPRDYRADYTLGQERYAVPWHYEPVTRNLDVNDRGFGISASYPDLAGSYVSQTSRDGGLVIWKREYSDEADHGVSLDEPWGLDACVSLAAVSNYFFVDGGFVYRIHNRGRTDIAFRDQNDLNGLKKRIVDLFESFKVHVQS